MPLDALPIDPFLPEIAKRLMSSSNLIIKASPGSGKTTRVPPYLLKHVSKEILVLEPRRAAAKMAALRVSDELGEPIGQKVGYHFRFEKNLSSQTRLKFLTEGMLIRYLLEDPTLDRVSTVILDEFHERHLHTDVAISILRQLQLSIRPDLKIIVMSATLDLPQLGLFLNAGEPIVIEAQLHPVKIEMASRPLSQLLHTEVARIVNKALQLPGDILVFLPGQKEIQACARELQNLNSADVLPLFGDLPIEKQLEVLKYNSNKRRVILSTNIAESSLTVEGLSQIIDSGLHRQARFSSWSGNIILETKKISRSSAIQRAGRAGRLGPGICWRLYTVADLNSRLEFDRPELERADLTSTALEISALGWNLAVPFPWFESPSKSDWSLAIAVLTELGALDNGLITECGRRMSRIPCPPRFARALIEAEQKNCSQEVANLIASLSGKREQEVDARLSLEEKKSSQSQRIYDSLLKNITAKTSSVSATIEESLVVGLYDRVAKIRRISTEKIELTMAFGGAIEAARHSRVWESSEYFLILEASELKEKGVSRAIARSVYPIHEDLLLNSQRTEVFEGLYWNESLKKIEKKSGMRYGELILMESKDKIAESDFMNVVEILIQEVIGIKSLEEATTQEILNKLSHFMDTSGLRSELARMDFALKAQVEVKLETSGPHHWLRLGLKGQIDVNSLSEINWLESWLSPMDGETQVQIKAQLDAVAPFFVKLQKGRQCKVNYEFDKSPWVESRMQDFFGMQEGPRINRGQTALTLHLLAPNYRSVQVTQDLQGFWKNHYPMLKTELKRRYPKHLWPDNP